MSRMFRYDPDHHRRSNNYLWLLLALVLFLLSQIPITFFPDYTRLILEIFLGLVILVGAYTATETEKNLRMGLLLGVLSLIALSVGFFNQTSVIFQILRIAAFSAFFFFLIRQIYLRVARSESVTLEMIYASISGFIILGFFAGQFCFILELLLPGSFKGLPDSPFAIYYYSFITLTTVGYGDISPANPAARALSIIIAICGQFYLTVLIAILVGKYLFNQRLEEED